MAKIDKYGLNIKQRKFADKYLFCGNAAEAYVFAYKPKTKDSRKIADNAAKIKKTPSVKLYIEMRQAEIEADARERGKMDAQELVDFLTAIIRGERDDVDFTVETESSSTMGSSSSTKTKRISKQWAIDRLASIIGADKGATANQNNVIIEEVD
jgi:phage terminase small subunit